MQNVILIHGLWHGSWCWSLVSEQLSARDVPSTAVDLEGHGLNGSSPQARWNRPFDPSAYATEPSATAGITASSAADALIEKIRLIGNGEPCVVVAHSIGGAVAGAAAERAPELFSHLIYVSGFAPVAGLPPAAYLGMPECAASQVGGLLAADPGVAGALRIDSGQRHEALRDCFYGDVDPALAEAAIGLLTPDAPLGITSEAVPVTRENYGRIPHSYVVCGQDQAIPPALQHRFVKEIDAVSAAPTTVVEMATSHAPFLSKPAELADVIASAFRDAGEAS